MVPIKENHANVCHYVATERNSPEPSEPPEPIPYASGYPETKSYLTELPYSGRNPYLVDPLHAEFPHKDQAADTLLAQNDTL